MQIFMGFNEWQLKQQMLDILFTSKSKMATSSFRLHQISQMLFP